MSLRTFHVVFIAASVVLAFYFAAWCLNVGSEQGPGWRAAGFASAATGLLLVAYEAWFLRKALPGKSQSALGGKRGLR